MGKFLRLPSEALEDVVALVTLETSQLSALAALCDSPDSVPPLKPSFLNAVAEKLCIDDDKARGILSLTIYLLTAVSEAGFPSQAPSDLRSLIATIQDPDEKADLLSRFDANRSCIESLLSHKPARARAIKRKSLLDGPELAAASFRTVCQLRPLFEGSEGREEIVGLVPMIVMELKLSRAEDSEELVSFSVSKEKLGELKRLVERTEMKMQAIAGRYGDQLVLDDWKV